MKIKTFHDDGAPYYERDNFILVATNDQDQSRSFSIGSGEPEDMYLFRDLSDALDVPELMKMAYEAGKAGEDFEIEAVESEEDL